MSDPTTPEPIQVNADPKQAQLAAGIRQAGAAIGVIVAAFGFTGAAAKIGIVVAVAPQIAVVFCVVGPAIWAAVTALGQLSTRRHAKQLATIAADPRVPDEVVQTVTK